MPINPYFGDYPGEQDLEEDINIELIQIMGRDVYYVPRSSLNLDQIFGEDPTSSFDAAYAIEAYIDTFEGPEGTDIVSQFANEIKQRHNLRIARKRFQELVQPYTNLDRPMEGDLIYFPLSKSLFEINYVQHLNPFYPLGRNWCYVLNIEMFTYSHEKINTGNIDVDEVYEEGSKPITNIQIGTGTGTFYAGQTVYQQNAGVTLLQGSVLCWTPASSLLEIDSITGSVSTLYPIVGITTDNYPGQPSYTVSSTNESYKKLPLGAIENTPIGDNEAFEEERFDEDILPYDEQNPFSEEND